MHFILPTKQFEITGRKITAIREKFILSVKKLFIDN